MNTVLTQHFESRVFLKFVSREALVDTYRPAPVIGIGLAVFIATNTDDLLCYLMIGQCQDLPDTSRRHSAFCRDDTHRAKPCNLDEILEHADKRSTHGFRVVLVNDMRPLAAKTRYEIFGSQIVHCPLRRDA